MSVFFAEDSNRLIEDYLDVTNFLKRDLFKKHSKIQEPVVFPQHTSTPHSKSQTNSSTGPSKTRLLIEQSKKLIVQDYRIFCGSDFSDNEPVTDQQVQEILNKIQIGEFEKKPEPPKEKPKPKHKTFQQVQSELKAFIEEYEY
jgi:LysM repeat protein